MHKLTCEHVSICKVPICFYVNEVCLKNLLFDYFRFLEDQQAISILQGIDLKIKFCRARQTTSSRMANG